MRRVLSLVTGFWLVGLMLFVIPAAAASWTSAGSMAIDRVGHMSVTLVDGRALVVGGFSNASGNGGYDTKLAEIYDPSTNSWSPTGSTASGRVSHVVTKLADGKVLVAGGINANICTNDVTTELYDAATGMWSPTGNLSLARADPTATLLADGKVLLAGGGNRCGAVYAASEVYDPSTGTWSPTGSMGTPRERASAVRLVDGRVLVAGGQTPSGGQFPSQSSAEIFDPATGVWTPTGSMATDRISFPLVLLSDGRVLATAGYTGNGFSFSPNGPAAEIFNPATGLWSSTGSLSVARSGGSFSRLDDGTVLAAGGAPDDLTNLSSAEIYDPGAGTWSPTASLATARQGQSASVLLNGKVLVAGGIQNNPRVYLSSAELYEQNEPPTIEATGGQCIHHNSSGQGVLSLTLDDADDDESSLTLSATSNNQVLLRNANIVLGGSGADRTMTIATVARKSGTAIVTVTVSDGEDSTQLDVTVKVDNMQSNVFAGTDGPDMLFGMAGNDTITAGASSDVLCGGSGSDTMAGGDGDDAMDGGAGNDALDGGDGADRLHGGKNNDTLTGGPGADFFSGGPGVDTKTDFNPGEGDTQDGT